MCAFLLKVILVYSYVCRAILLAIQTVNVEGFVLANSRETLALIFKLSKSNQAFYPNLLRILQSDAANTQAIYEEQCRFWEKSDVTALFAWTSSFPRFHVASYLLFSTGCVRNYNSRFREEIRDFLMERGMEGGVPDNVQDFGIETWEKLLRPELVSFLPVGFYAYLAEFPRYAMKIDLLSLITLTCWRCQLKSSVRTLLADLLKSQIETASSLSISKFILESKRMTSDECRGFYRDLRKKVCGKVDGSNLDRLNAIALRCSRSSSENTANLMASVIEDLAMTDQGVLIIIGLGLNLINPGQVIEKLGLKKRLILDVTFSELAEFAKRLAICQTHNRRLIFKAIGHDYDNTLAFAKLDFEDWKIYAAMMRIPWIFARFRRAEMALSNLRHAALSAQMDYVPPPRHHILGYFRVDEMEDRIRAFLRGHWSSFVATGNNMISPCLFHCDLEALRKFINMLVYYKIRFTDPVIFLDTKYCDFLSEYERRGPEGVSLEFIQEHWNYCAIINSSDPKNSIAQQSWLESSVVEILNTHHVIFGIALKAWGLASYLNRKTIWEFLKSENI